MRKFLTTKSHDCDAPIPLQCSVISLVGHLKDFITFVVVRFRQMKVLKKNSRLGVTNPQETQNTETPPSDRFCFYSFW